MKFFTTRVNNQKGQALLIVVLIMVVALTVTLSLVSRSVVNLKTAVDQTNSQKALSAAEAGVEQAIRNSVSIGQTGAPPSLDGAQYKATLNSVAYTSGVLVNGGNIVGRDEGSYVWLTQYDSINPWTHSSWPSDSASDNADLYLYWGDNSGDSKNAAIEVALIAGPNKTDVDIRRLAFDPYQARANTNHFDYTNVQQAGPYVVNGKTFTYRVTITAISQGLLLRLNPIYASTYIAVKRVSSSDPILPDQGQIITSSGTVGSVQRKITVYQGYPVLPAELFPYSLISP